MKALQLTELEADEKMIFGPVTSTKTASFSGSAGPSQSGVSRTTGHTVGVTNQRVIFEDIGSPQKTQVIPNMDVQRVFIRHKRCGGRPTITLSQVQAVSGQTIKLNIQGLLSQTEASLQNVFSNAEITLDKSSGCGYPLIAAILVRLPSSALAVPLNLGVLGS